MLKLLVHFDTSNRRNGKKDAKCFPYLQNSKAPEQLYENNYSPQAQLTLLNSPLDSVSGDI